MQSVLCTTQVLGCFACPGDVLVQPAYARERRSLIRTRLWSDLPIVSRHSAIRWQEPDQLRTGGDVNAKTNMAHPMSFSLATATSAFLALGSSSVWRNWLARCTSPNSQKRHTGDRAAFGIAKRRAFVPSGARFHEERSRLCPGQSSLRTHATLHLLGSEEAAAANLCRKVGSDPSG